jgi:hypothetical protein
MPVLLAVDEDAENTGIADSNAARQSVISAYLEEGFTPPDKSCSFSRYCIEILYVYRKSIRIVLPVSHFISSTRVPP